MSGTVPDPQEVRGPLAALNTALSLTPGPAALTFTVDTPNGPVAFG
jgi:molybdopterin-guanine dinucleotide biosynthesis protein A